MNIKVSFRKICENKPPPPPLKYKLPKLATQNTLRQVAPPSIGPPGGLYSEISLEYDVKPSKNHDGKFQFTSIYKASPVDFETQISLRRSATPNIIPSKLSPSKRAFEKISPGAYFRNFTVAQVFKTSTIEVLCEVVELGNPRTAYVWHIPNTLSLVSARNNHNRKFQ